MKIFLERWQLEVLPDKQRIYLADVTAKEFDARQNKKRQPEDCRF